MVYYIMLFGPRGLPTPRGRNGREVIVLVLVMVLVPVLVPVLVLVLVPVPVPVPGGRNGREQADSPRESERPGRKGHPI